MRVESVAYRFSRDEVLALMVLAGVDCLPGLTLGDFGAVDVEEGLRSLEEAGIALSAGERWTLERSLLYLIRGASRAERLLKADDGAGHLLLYRLKGCALLARPTPDGACAFTPYRTMAEAWGGWRSGLCAMKGATVTLALSSRERVLSLRRLPRAQAAAIGRETLECALHSWEPAGKEDDPWKP